MLLLLVELESSLVNKLEIDIQYNLSSLQRTIFINETAPLLPIVTKIITVIFGAKALNWSLLLGTQDPGPELCLIGTPTLGTQMTCPEYWDSNFWTQVLGPE